MRHLVLIVLVSLVSQAQTPNASEPAQASAPAVERIIIEAAPLAPSDPGAVYASPRDAARHRLQATLAELQARRDVRSAIRGFAEAFATDRTYAAAAFNLGVVAALAEEWQDAISALEEAARLDPAVLGRKASPQIERLRQMALLQAAPDGERRIRYDLALFPVLQKIQKTGTTEAIADLVEVGRIDPKRWEAPALLAGLLGKVRGYDAASKFLEIAAGNAAEPAVKAGLQKALRAAERETSYAIARASAEAASNAGEYEKAAGLYENAWAAVPARSWNGMDAAAAWLVRDDTARAAKVLQRLCKSGDDDLARQATSMIEQLKTVEPSATAPPIDAEEFFRDRGSSVPAAIEDLLPAIDRERLETLSRPPPKLVEDGGAVVLLGNLSADRPEGAPSLPLPALPAARIAGEHPWRELQMLPARTVPPAPAERSRQTVQLAGNPKTRFKLAVTTLPHGASIFLNDGVEATCLSPCDIQVPSGSYSVRANLEGYDAASSDVTVGRESVNVELSLSVSRGAVAVETPVGAKLKVNDTPVATSGSALLSLSPGLYRFTVEIGGSSKDQYVTVNPAAKLKLRL